MRRIATISAFLGSAALSFLAFAPRAAQAGWTSYHASECTTLTGGQYLNDYGQAANSSGSSQGLTCPVHSDDLHRASKDGTYAWVFGYENGLGVFGRACRTYAGGYGGVCGSTFSGPPNGNSTYGITIQGNSPSTAPPWKDSGNADGLYILMSMPGMYQGSSNVVFSYVVNTP